MKRTFLSLLILFSITSAMAHDFKVYGLYYNITDETNKTVEVTYHGDNAFEPESRYSGDVVIPESVTYDGTTYNVTAIGDYAFYYCTGLTSVTILGSVTSIGDYAFYYCTGLTSITIPNSVTSIGDYTFYYCTGLTSITIPNSVTEIGYRAFMSCMGLTSITIPNSVTSIGGDAFWRTPYYNNMPDGVVYINNVLYKYKGTMPANTTIEVREGTVSISGRAFENCTGLTSITIPNSVTEIGDEAFRNCTGLTSVTIPNSVTSIGDYAFYSCYGLTEITIPESVTTIGNYAFRECEGLTSITIPNSVTSIGEYAFYGTPYYNNMPDGVVYINNVLYKYKGTMPANTTIEVREGTVSISGSAFDYCPDLTSITIPESVTSIGGYAFYYCTGLTSITIPEGVTEIGDYVFAYCTGLTSITIPNSVTTIGNYAFYYCTGLTSITIPEGVTSIGDYVFAYCSGLTEVTCLATTPPTVYSSTFLNVTNTIPLYVPAESVEAYNAAYYWNEFTKIQAYEKITTDKVFYLDCNDQTEWAVDENSIVEAVFTNAITGYETTVQGSVMQSNDGTSTYTSVLFYLAEGNSYVATNGVENARYSHVEFKLNNPEAVTRSSGTTLTTGALYLADATKPIYRLATDEWVSYDPTATGIDDALAEDTIAVRGDVVTALGDIYVYNMSGAMVAYGRDEIDLSALQRGIYLIHAGGTVKKIVK